MQTESDRQQLTRTLQGLLSKKSRIRIAKGGLNSKSDTRFLGCKWEDGAGYWALMKNQYIYKIVTHTHTHTHTHSRFRWQSPKNVDNLKYRRCDGLPQALWGKCCFCFSVDRFNLLRWLGGGGVETSKQVGSFYHYIYDATYIYIYTHTITTWTYLIRISIYHKDFKTTVGPISKLPLWHSWWNEYKMITPFEMDPSLNKVYSGSCEYYYRNTCWAPHLEIIPCASQQQLYSTVLSSRADQPRSSRMRQYGQTWSVHEVMFTMTRPVQLCANVIHSVSAGDWFHSSSAERSSSSFFNGCNEEEKNSIASFVWTVPTRGETLPVSACQSWLRVVRSQN